MKIQTKLRISLAVALIVTIGIIYTVVVTNARMVQLQEQSEVARQLVTETFEMNMVARDYLLHHEERARAQWLLTYDQIIEIVDQDVFSGEEDNKMITAIKQDLDDMLGIFNEMVALRRPNADALALRTEAESRLENQLMIKSQSIVSKATQLSERNLEEQGLEHSRSNWLIILMVGGLALVMISILLLFQRAVSLQLTKLRLGIEAASQGDFTKKLPMRSNDEIGQLARSFNEMIDRLKQTYQKLEAKNIALEEKSRELEKINKLMVDRELRMAELKKKLPGQ